MGQFLSLNSVKEMIQYDDTEEDVLSDEEIEAILLMHNVRKVQQDKNLSDEALSKELGINNRVLINLENGEKHPTTELTVLRSFTNAP
ncbi:helix-turn-helix domain-containing protein [Tetragenococcus solitarius]|uniref:HTH cro/C1-type domain-containing protein n=1 Tax=Tetragenococcus solitarius TaxID=71453 RepID=A0ABN3Y1G1_9ENTE|nr:helix-turn-helix domain-containing protein [Tetragenococcus solitarius]